MRPTVAVCFVETPLFSNLADYHLIFELRERKHQTLFTDQMALHILELSKFRKSVNELATPLDRWLFFLRHGEDLDPDALPEPLNVPDVRWALGDLLMISQSDRERDLYESRVKMRRDMAALRSEGLEEGREEGLEEGREEGLEKGREEGLEKGREEGRAEEHRALIQFLQKRLHHEVMTPEQLQTLSPHELANLVDRLQAELDTKLALLSE